MTKSSGKAVLLSLTVLAVLVGIVAYPLLPDMIAAHWNAQGVADGTMSKFWGIFLVPMIMAGFFVLYLLIPRIDPLKGNIESFRKHFDRFWIGLYCFFLYIFTLTLVWNFGYRFNFTTVLLPAIAALWYLIGSLLEHVKRNWFMGIRTPWTLSDDVVWEKTHRLGGSLFKLAAVFSLAGFFTNDGTLRILLIIVPAFVIGIVTIVYSYVVYRARRR